MRDIIEKTFFEVAKQTEAKLSVEKLDDDTILLESGLDSLGFAILVASLEEKLEFDPFSLSDEPFYPKSFKEFVDFYEKFKP